MILNENINDVLIKGLCLSSLEILEVKDRVPLISYGDHDHFLSNEDIELLSKYNVTKIRTENFWFPRYNGIRCEGDYIDFKGLQVNCSTAISNEMTDQYCNLNLKANIMICDEIGKINYKWKNININTKYLVITHKVDDIESDWDDQSKINKIKAKYLVFFGPSWTNYFRERMNNWEPFLEWNRDILIETECEYDMYQMIYMYTKNKNLLKKVIRRNGDIYFGVMDWEGNNPYSECKMFLLKYSQGDMRGFMGPKPFPFSF